MKKIINIKLNCTDNLWNCSWMYENRELRISVVNRMIPIQIFKKILNTKRVLNKFTFIYFNNYSSSYVDINYKNHTILYCLSDSKSIEKVLSCYITSLGINFYINEIKSLIQGVKNDSYTTNRCTDYIKF